jgi:perosamine synthetase
MTNIAAAIGLAQLGRVNDTLKRKREIADFYRSRLEPVQGVVLQSEAPWARNIYWMFSILVPPAKRDRLCDYLSQHGVETRPFFYPAHRMPVYAEYEKQEFPIAQKLAASGINLPSGPTLTDDEIDYVCTLVKKFLREH